MSDIAVIIDNLVQFYSIRQGIDALMAKGVGVDIYIPHDPNMKNQVNYTYQNVVNAGYAPFKKAKKIHYKVLLEPYPKLENKVSLNGITFTYRLKFKYSLISAKPNPVYHPSWNMPYDAILTNSTYEYRLLKAFTQTHLVKPYRKRHIKKRKSSKPTNKRRLLYLPTFNDVDQKYYSAIERVFKKLSKNYEITIKAHHATQFRESEKRHNEFLHTLAETIYDQATPLSEILEGVDIVLTGNSGSIFEAIYYGRPVAVFASNINKHKLGADTFQYQLVRDGVLPCANRPSEIPRVLHEAFTKIEAQNSLYLEQFNNPNVQYEDFCDVVIDYMGRDDKTDYIHQLHNQLTDYVNFLQNEKLHLSKDLAEQRQAGNQLKSEIRDYRRKVSDYEQSTSWRITRPLRELNKRIGGVVKDGER